MKIYGTSNFTGNYQVRQNQNKQQKVSLPSNYPVTFGKKGYYDYPKNRIQERKCDDKTKVITEFNRDGKCIKSTHQNRDGSIIDSREIEYNRRGHVSKEVFTNPDGSIDTWNFEEDANSKMTKSTHTKSDGSVETFEYKHNKDGSYEEIHTKSDGSKILAEKNNGLDVKKIFLDSKGNLIKTVTYQRDKDYKLVRALLEKPDGTKTTFKDYQYRGLSTNVRTMYGGAGVSYCEYTDGLPTKVICESSDGKISTYERTYNKNGDICNTYQIPNEL